jgi:outer membrane protein OmpA-like peptidoglycan-associated protein
MTSRHHPHRSSLLLAGTAIVTMAALPQSSFADVLRGSSPLVIAQAAPAENAPADKKPAKPGAQQQQKPQERTTQQPQRQEQRPQERATQQQQQPQERAPQQQQRQQERATQQQQPQEQRRQERANERRPGQPQAPAAQQQQPSPSTAQQPQTTTPPTAQDRRDQRRPGQPPQAPAAQQQQPSPSTAQQPQTTTPPTAQDRRDQRRPGQPLQAPAAQQQQPSPSTAQQPQTTNPPTAQDRRDQRRPGQPPQAPAAQQQQPSPSTAQQPQTTTPPTAQDRRDQRRPGQPLQAPTAQQPVQQAPAAAQVNPAAVAPPTQPRDAREFVRRDGQGPARKIEDIRKDRQETREGNRVFIREGDRTIIRENNTTIIRHNESNRFTINASNVRSERRGANTETIVQRGGGYSIVTVTDDSGRLLRRLRRDQRGRDVVIIDNGFAGPRAANIFLQLPPPVIRIPRERYIVDMRRSRPDDIYGVFIAPPVEPLAERYTLDQVRFSAPLRDRMPRVDLDVTFDSGSWQLTPDQIDKLSVIAEGINKTLQRNPREVFMVEGYTDATGADDDNLSLSDRRAESVAVALTEQFNVPPENLVTQGYGEQYLKVDTQGPEEANRRVAVRRITPLIDGPATNATR